MAEPRVFGRLVFGTFRFWCRWCGREHIHGAGDDANNPTLGRRGAHCWNRRSPFFGKGYVLALRPPKGGSA